MNTVTIHTWIKWAFIVSDVPHRLSSFIHARQASRDLGVLISEAEFDSAMSEYTYSHTDKRGERHYFVDDSPAKGRYDFKRYVLVEPLVHPLLVPNPQDAFNVLPDADKTTILDWIKSSLRTGTPRHVNLFREPCNLMLGLDLTEEQMMGTLLVAGHRQGRTCHFHAALTDTAFRAHKKAQRACQPIPDLQASNNL